MITGASATPFMIIDHDFVLKIDRSAGPDACWPWLGFRNVNGYGMVQRRRVMPRPMLAHRYAFYLATGRQPTLHLLHSCDHPCCVNPRHLREGTALDNVRDAIERGRHVDPPTNFGEAHPNSRRVAAGERHVDIASSLGVARTTVTAVARGQNWGAA